MSLEEDPRYLYDPEPDPRRRRSHRVPPQLKSWVYGRRTRRHKADPRRRRRSYRRRYDPQYVGYRSRAKGIFAKFSKFITTGVFALATVQQATDLDMKFPGLDTIIKTPLGKIQYVASKFIERVTFGSITLFQPIEGYSFGPPSKPALNPSNCLNKWTGLGVGALVYSMIPGLPYRGIAKKFAKGAIAGGIIGGLLDEALPGTSNSTGQSQTMQVPQGTFWSVR